jgi:hypothetical protein
MTQNYGRIYFQKIYYGTSKTVNDEQVAEGGSVGILSNGSWVYFPSGHQIEDPEDAVRILDETNKRDKTPIKAFREWWEHREEVAALASEEGVVRPIMICPDDVLRYEDDYSEVTKVTDIYDYFPPKSMALEMALRLFTINQQDREKQAVTDLLSKNRTDPTSMDDAFGRLHSGAGRPAPVSADEAKQNAITEAKRANLEKAREARRMKIQEKKRLEAEKAEKEDTVSV